MRDDNKPVYAASSSSISQLKLYGSDEDDSLDMPGYSRMVRGERGFGQSRAKDENHVGFAKCLLLMYEKAINVQF